jgi:Fe-S cluster assembly scaffold protein SufB
MKKSLLKPKIIKIDKDTSHIIKKPGYYIFEIIKPNIKIDIFSAIKAKGNEEKELNVVIHHKAPKTTAQTTLKAVGFDKSTLIMKAKILIDPGCQETESFLTERVLLLSKDAHALAIPDLEILTDDVKCSHAASVTQIPEEQIFYLTSRGISKKTAENMIVKGFLQMTE